MTPEAFRNWALTLPDTLESSHHQHPDFRVGKKVFATLGYPDSRFAMVKLTPAQQAHYTQAHPEVFVPVKGGWGRNGSTQVKLRPATRATVLPALVAAWRNAASATLSARHPDLP